MDLGFSPAGTRIRKKVSGKTKVEVRDKLRELHKETDAGLRPRRRYTVGDALEDWLAHGVDGLSEQTVTLYRGTIMKALNEELGAIRLTELTASDVQGALGALAARLSTRTVQIAHNVLVRAIRHAERDDLVGRNVAALVDAPKGQQAGRPIAGHLAALDRFAKLERALSRTQLTSPPPISTLGEPAIGNAEAWLAPIALAKERGLCLWSDMSSSGTSPGPAAFPAFGTVTLQQLRAAERLNADEVDDETYAAVLAARRSEVTTALRERVVDVPADPDSLIEQARREGWSRLDLAAATLGRAVWWTLTPTPWADLQALLAAVPVDSGPAAAWQQTAMWGVSELARDDPSRAAALIACVCLIENSLANSVDHAVAMFRAGVAVAARRNAPPPTEHLAQAAISLAAAGVLADPLEFVTEVRARLDQDQDDV